MPDHNPSAHAISSTARFHSHLNTKVWTVDGDMIPAVRLKLLQSAMAFYHFIDEDGLAIRDIHLTGSNAAFNYTTRSDLDVHLVVAFDKTPCPGLSANLFLTKKALWGMTYDVTVRGLPVEMYVEDSAMPAKSNGVYSILNDAWISAPKPVAPARDDAALVKKTEAYVDRIEDLLGKSPSVSEIDDMLGRLHEMRSAGLESGGEFSVENLTYKALRALGYLDKLWNTRIKAIADDLSLKEAALAARAVAGCADVLPSR